MLINCVAEKASAHSGEVYSVAFSPDGTKVVSGIENETIKVWDSGALLPSNHFSLIKKLTLAGLSGRHDGAVEREDERPQPTNHVGGVFPRWDQDCVGIVGPYGQSLGFGCAFALRIAPPWPKLTPVGLPGRQAGDAEREDKRPQRLHQVGCVFPGRDQDCVWIGRQDDQSLGFGCAAPSNRLSLAETDASWLVWQPRWGCRARRRTPTAATSGRSPSPRTGPRLCLDLTTRRSKSGIQVRCEPSKSRLLGEN